mmetsp:Transcript_95125/g.264318  ORF Transcript_95125/g.264318 Transcript_95125/m.264318 type:complete len:97 (-) Transcript_95125:155-445(-)
MFPNMMMKGNDDNSNSHTDDTGLLPQITSVRVLPRNTRARWSHSPIVTAMLTGNTLQSCEAVEALLAECYESNSDDRICQAAARQFARCIPLQEQK